MTNHEFPMSKIKNIATLSRIIKAAKAKKKKIVFTNGCFDILHVGHVEYLSRAKKMGDVLIIGLNSDSSVKKLKGVGRPVNKERDRAKVLSALYFVDYVTIFNEETPERLIKKIAPDVLVKGGDWDAANIAGSGFVRSHGGKVRIVPFVKGFSTTSLIKRMLGD